MVLNCPHSHVVLTIHDKSKDIQLLADDGFIQSMSARGISQDNAPMESFFGRMKTEIIDLIARCPSSEVVKE